MIGSFYKPVAALWGRTHFLELQVARKSAPELVRAYYVISMAMKVFRSETERIGLSIFLPIIQVISSESVPTGCKAKQLTAALEESFQIISFNYPASYRLSFPS